MMLREFRDRLLDHLAEVPLPVEIVRLIGLVIPLEGAVVRLPVLTDRLEENEGLRERFRNSFFARLLAIV
jgi:hypothetical protein